MSQLTGNAVKVSILQSLASATLPSVQDSAGTEYGRFCRAFVNFSGNPASIRASFNVSSITENDAGDYTVNFTTAMPDANYAINVTAKRTSQNRSLSGSHSSTAPATGSCRIIIGMGSHTGSFTQFNGDFVNVSVFR